MIPERDLPPTAPEARLRTPPNRLPWEAPPPLGWEPALHGWATESLYLLSGLAAGLAALLAGREAITSADPWPLRLALWALAIVAAGWAGLYLWRKLGALALLLSMALDHGRLARSGGRPVAWLEGEPAAALRLAHLSDLHVAEAADVRLVEAARPAGNAALERLLLAPELRGADALVITGDLTDRGTADSWQELLRALESSGLAERTVLVPGNHDLMLVRLVDRVEALASDRFGVVQLANYYKFAQAFARTAGGQRGLVLRTEALALPARPEGALRDAREVVPWSEAWAGLAGQVRELLDRLPFGDAPAPGLLAPVQARRAAESYGQRIEGCRRRLQALFPVAVPVGAQGVVFVLDSCTLPSRHPASNSFGKLGREQLLRLEALAAHLPQRLRLVALHHHLVRRGEEQAAGWRNRLFARFGVLADWRPLLGFCREAGVRAVLNGHRHLSYQLRLPNGTVLLAAPSSTLGDELALDPRPGFELYSFAPEPVDGTQVAIHRRAVRFGG